jgi:hypothetical protein
MTTDQCPIAARLVDVSDALVNARVPIASMKFKRIHRARLALALVGLAHVPIAEPGCKTTLSPAR